MKKIMFNDRYGLTRAVFEGRKKQTRRIIKLDEFGKYSFENTLKQDWGTKCIQAYIENKASYKVGEIVAIAQAYKEVASQQDEAMEVLKLYKIGDKLLTKEELGAGWSNKMFVKAELMPHHIRIINVKIERLQDISDVDCLAEGIEFDHKAQMFYVNYNRVTGSRVWLSDTPRKSFAVLIDKISGRGIWNSNPFVFVYKFELVD